MALFCCLDDSAQLFHQWQQHHLIPSNCQRQRAGKLSLGEMPFILVLLPLAPDKNFKHFWRYSLE